MICWNLEGRYAHAHRTAPIVIIVNSVNEKLLAPAALSTFNVRVLSSIIMPVCRNAGFLLNYDKNIRIPYYWNWALVLQAGIRSGTVLLRMLKIECIYVSNYLTSL